MAHSGLPPTLPRSGQGPSGATTAPSPPPSSRTVPARRKGDGKTVLWAVPADEEWEGGRGGGGGIRLRCLYTLATPIRRVENFRYVFVLLTGVLLDPIPPPCSFFFFFFFPFGCFFSRRGLGCVGWGRALLETQKWMESSLRGLKEDVQLGSGSMPMPGPMEKSLGADIYDESAARLSDVGTP